jgi:hypothetical protein
MNADRHGFKHKELTETEFFHVDEVSTGSGSDRVIALPIPSVGRINTRSLPHPVLTSLTSVFICGQLK